LIRKLILWLCLGAGLVSAATAKAQTPQDVYASRVREMVSILSLKGGEERVFAPSFLAEIPTSKIRTLAEQLIAQNGPLLRLDSVHPSDGFDGKFRLSYARAKVSASMVLGRSAPFQVIGFQIENVTRTGDSAASLENDIRALPGRAGMVVTRLGREPIMSVGGDAPLAIGSVFKLWLLAEASRQVNAKQRNWTDVVRLGPPSLPSGMTQDWPKGAPMTLHSLATLAISISDNSASDTLLSALGRSNVNAMVARAGHHNPGLTLPLLSTVEAFALKTDEAVDLRTVWENGDQVQRERMLSRAKSWLRLESIDKAQFAGKPRSIGTVEWFATPNDMARLLDWLRLNGGKDALAIMGVTSPLLKGEAARFRSVGFKGGSEIGVIALALIVQTQRGDWYAVTGAWNESAGPVDEVQFDGLMKRAVGLIPD
jgi:Beta-lactamase enzyme family